MDRPVPRRPDQRPPPAEGRVDGTLLAAYLFDEPYFPSSIPLFFVVPPSSKSCLPSPSLINYQVHDSCAKRNKTGPFLDCSRRNACDLRVSVLCAHVKMHTSTYSSHINLVGICQTWWAPQSPAGRYDLPPPVWTRHICKNYEICH